MVTLLEIMMTVSPLFTSWPSTRLQEVTVPSMGATALKSAMASWASSSFFCCSWILVSMVDEPKYSSSSPS